MQRNRFLLLVLHSARSKCSKPRGETTRVGQLKRKLVGEIKVETYERQNQVRGSSTQTATPWPPHALSSPAASCSWALAAELPTAEKSCLVPRNEEENSRAEPRRIFLYFTRWMATARSGVREAQTLVRQEGGRRRRRAAAGEAIAIAQSSLASVAPLQILLRILDREIYIIGKI